MFNLLKRNAANKTAFSKRGRYRKTEATSNKHARHISSYNALKPRFQFQKGQIDLQLIF